MKEPRENKRSIVEGKIWWGNKYFLKDNIKSEGNREEEAKENFITLNFPETENLILFLNKYVPIIKAKITNRYKNKNKTKIWFDIQNKCIGGDSKKIFLAELVNRFKTKSEYYAKITNLKIITDNQKNSLEKQGYKLIYSNNLKTQSRLIVGLGSSHVLETSITLHHIYGIPYIPASALKGVCRMFTFWKTAEKKNILNNENALKDLQKNFYGELSHDEDILKYQLLFGAQNFRGLLLFLDAYPVLEDNQEIFDLDIMNVHYPSYYGDETGKTPPGDWEDPRPIVFLTLKEGVKFNFGVLFDEFRAEKISKSSEEELKELNIPTDAKKIAEYWGNNPQQLKNEINELIEVTLKEFGTGAKTRLGYGIFE